MSPARLPRATRKQLTGARRAHMKRDWATARAGYTAVIEGAAEHPAADEARAALELVEREEVPAGRSGYRAFAWFLLAPLMWALGTLAAELGNTEALMVASIFGGLFAILAGVVSGLRALFRERGWGNKLAGAAAVGLVAAVFFASLEYEDQKRRRFMVHEGISAAAAAKMGIAEYYSEHERFPASNAEAGLVEPENLGNVNVRDVTVSAGGVITVVYARDPVAGETLVMQASADEDGQLSWDCTGGTVAPDARPAACR